MSQNIEHMRERIEQLSLQILELLNQRARCTGELAHEKRRLALPLRDLRREACLLERLKNANTGPLDATTVQSIFQSVMDGCVRLMNTGGEQTLRIESGAPVEICIRDHRIGHGPPQYIAGPCSVESETQLDQTAAALAAQGVRFLRGGAFKPRTSPYSFQGLGEPGLKILHDAAHRHDMVTVSEATSLANLEIVARYADIIQIGARNMYCYELLRAAGKLHKPVMLKRAFSATLDEWLQAAEYISVGGSDEIILCERGVRTFGNDTRATLDLSVVPLALAHCRLPVVVDVSHAAGRRDILAPLARAAFGVGASAVMIEVHPDPDAALSDPAQQITPQDFEALRQEVAVGLGHLRECLMDKPAKNLNGKTNDAPKRSLQL